MQAPFNFMYMWLCLDISLCTCGESTIGELATVMRMSEEFSHLTQETKANDKGMTHCTLLLPG